MARLLGIGGYFMATDVSHTIGPQGYTVSVRGLQQGLSFKSSATKIAAIPTEQAIDEDPTQDLLDQDARVVEQLREEAAINAAATELGMTIEQIDAAIAAEVDLGLSPQSRAEYVQTLLDEQEREENPEDYDN